MKNFVKYTKNTTLYTNTPEKKYIERVIEIIMTPLQQEFACLRPLQETEWMELLCRLF